MRTLLLTLILSCLFTPASFAKDYSRLFKKVDPAVVVIVTSEKTPTLTAEGIKHTEMRGLGSGIIINRSGVILTAAHVIGTADEIEVLLSNGETYKARVRSSIAAADLAVIELLDPPDNLTTVKLGDSDKIGIGAEVFVIGSPYGLQHTLTVGHLSGRRITKDTPFDDIEFLQTDAAINQGNSGGPLFDSKGRLIGIVTHISTKSGGSEGLGFAASINMAKRLFIDSPPIYLGADFVLLNDQLAAAINAGHTNGMLIQHVAKDSLATKMGLKGGYIPAEIGGIKLLLGGDIITQVNGVNLYATNAGIKRIFESYKTVRAGDVLSLTVTRGGEQITLTATVE